MEETPEGLALAAATREAIKERKRALEEGHKEPPPKRPTRPVTPCQHDVAIPEGYIPPELDVATYGTIQQPMWDGEMAKSYPFRLDPFQATAVACIERSENVLVAAHTSAGKTAVAEYAIAKAFKADQKVVYTSPLKALSNQKFRELTEEFGDVGLMTGDVTLNPNAACMVMTTEILRSMIYRGSELLREIAWVIFDEVHYMKDRERGVVWEEVIIFMPKGARMVFLSATLPNSMEFAEWIAAVHGAPCHVVSTDYRPTPLVHYAWPMGGNGLYLLVDDKGNFKADNFKQVRTLLGGDKPAPLEEMPQSAAKGKKKGGKGGPGEKKIQGPPVEEEVDKLMHLLKEKRLEPIIVFSFGRRDCENYARLLSGAIKKKKKGGAGGPLDFNTPEEKETVAAIVDSALQCLTPEDRELRFVKIMVPMLLRGIGVHHSGLLPILKELVEVLFQEQLIKCLFSTETFAMGLNMPAKTVVFTTLRKWDGEATRFVESGEYIQMSGRAGRRGKDDRGLAIMMADDKLDEATCRAMVKGSAAPLDSSFKLTYYTLLNLLRRMEGGNADMEFVIARSFSQFQYEKRIPELRARVASLRQEAEDIGMSIGADSVVKLLDAQSVEAGSRKTIMSAVLQPDKCVHFLRAGRIVRLKVDADDFGYGVVVSVMRSDDGSSGGTGTAYAADRYIVDVLVCCKKGSGGRLEPCSMDDEAGEMLVVPAKLTLLSMLSTLRIAIPSNLKEKGHLKAVRHTLTELISRYPGGVLPELHPVEDMGIEDEAVIKAIEAEKEAKATLKSMADSGSEQLTAAEREAQLRRKAQLLMEADDVEKKMQENQLTNFKEESKNRLALLRKLGHVDADGMVTLKGRAASEIDTADELLTSELMFNGTFGSLDKHEIAALVSCLIQVENSQSEVKLSQQLGDVLGQMQQTAREIAETTAECKLEIDADKYIESFNATLMDVVYQWSKGASFGTICELTDVFEGSIIRAIRRLDELLVNLNRAASVVGDTKLAELFEDSRQTLRRGLPFAASLYI